MRKVDSIAKSTCLSLVVMWIFTFTCFSEIRQVADRDLTPVMHMKNPDPRPVVLIRGGKAVGQISLPEYENRRKISSPLFTAIRDFNQVVEKVTGTSLPLSWGEVATAGIVIATEAWGKKMGLLQKALKPEGFEIRSLDGKLYVFAWSWNVERRNARIHAGAWALYDILERVIGVRWFMPYEHGTTYPKKSADLSFASLWYRDAPVFREREIWPSNKNGIDGDILLKLHRRLRSGSSHSVTQITHAPFMHLLPDREELFKKFGKEIMQLNADGRRDHEMLCYSHPKTLELFKYFVNKNKNKSNRYEGIIGNTVAVSPADKEIGCSCEPCKKLWDPEGGRYGSGTNILVTFIAKFAKYLKKHHPEKTIWFQPYLNWTAPPSKDIVLPGNVEVQICFTQGFARLKEPAEYELAKKFIERWRKVTGRKVRYWQYTCWPESSTSAVFQYPGLVQKYYREFRDVTAGTFINGETDHWPRQNLTIYFWLKTLWNPDIELEPVIESFTSRLFGRAAAPMRELVELQIEGWEKSRWLSGKLSSKNIFKVSYPKASTDRMKALFKEAFRLAQGDELVLERLKYYRKPFTKFFAQADDFHSGKVKKMLTIQKYGLRPKIDGKLDDAAWTMTPKGSFVKAKSGAETKYDTFVQAVYDFEGITFAFKAMEPTPDKVMTGNGGRDNPQIWWDDNIEIFLDVTGKGNGEFVQFIINPKGAYFDARNRDMAWNTSKILRASQMNADHWSMEVFIPYDAFPDALKPASGSRTQWLGNFTRHRVADRRLHNYKFEPGSEREYQRFNTTGQKISANLDDFVPFRFKEGL